MSVDGDNLAVKRDVEEPFAERRRGGRGRGERDGDFTPR